MLVFHFPLFPGEKLVIFLTFASAADHLREPDSHYKPNVLHTAFPPSSADDPFLDDELGDSV